MIGQDTGQDRIHIGKDHMDGRGGYIRPALRPTVCGGMRGVVPVMMRGLVRDRHPSGRSSMIDRGGQSSLCLGGLLHSIRIEEPGWLVAHLVAVVMLRRIRCVDLGKLAAVKKFSSPAAAEGRTFAYFDNLEVKDGVCIGKQFVELIYASRLNALSSPQFDSMDLVE
jgi:hypothetical protein